MGSRQGCEEICVGQGLMAACVRKETGLEGSLCGKGEWVGRKSVREWATWL